MNFTACITTMNRSHELDICLGSLWASTVKPYLVVVSDNSVDPNIQEKNQFIVSQYPRTIYLEGPHAGVSSNRNNALRAVPPETDLISIFPDDLVVQPNYIERVIGYYAQMSPEQSNNTILSGVCISDMQYNLGDEKNLEKYAQYKGSPLQLSFRGYFLAANPPQVVALAASVFPRSFFDREEWDENIYLGQEDAEISLRAIKQGYQIWHCPDLKTIHTRHTTMPIGKVGRLTDYEIYAEASRLYIGIKRYKYLFPNLLKLWAFQISYFAHMIVYLLKRGSLGSLSEIVQRSNIQRLSP